MTGGSGKDKTKETRNLFNMWILFVLERKHRLREK